MPAVTDAPVVLPASHVDLLQRALPAVLTTHLSDGRLQSTVVWCECSQERRLLVNTMREFQKARNLRARPRATVLVVEPGQPSRWIEVRARVVPDLRDPVAHLDALSRRYTGVAPYFGRVVPAELAHTEHPVVYRLVPMAVRTGPWYDTLRPPLPVPPPTPPARPAAAPGCRHEPDIPASHRDLLQRPLPAALSTRLPGGAAQVNPVWCSIDGNDVLVNTTRQRRKARNLGTDPRATILAVDPDDAGRWIEIRGDVELSDHGAHEHLDRLTQQYTGHRHYYGTIYPVQQRYCETRVIARIHPRHINCDAIHH